MTANLEQFTCELDGLLGLRPAPVTATDPALQTATVLLAPHIEAESTPPADLRARWISRTQLPLSTEKKSIMQTLRAKPALLFLVILLALTLLTGVAYAIGKSLGYIPGFGFTSDARAVMMLKETMSAESGGVTVSVEKAVSDGSRFWVEISVSGLPPAGHDFPQAFILIPSEASGEKIQSQMGGSTDTEAGEARLTFTFPALTGNPLRVTLLIENLGGQNFSLPLELRPIQPGELIPAPPTEAAPLQSETHGGLTLVLENVAPDKDKTVFQVSLHFAQEGMSLNSDWNAILTDTDGRVYPLTDITPETLDIGETRIYQTMAFSGSERLTLSLVVFPDSENLPIMVSFMLDEAGFTFDPGASPRVGQAWALDETVQVGAYTLHVVGARLVAPNELLFEFSPADSVTGVMLYSTQAGGSSGGIPTAEGNFTAGMTFGKIPDQPFMVYVSSVYYTARGKWEIHWQPSASPMQASGFPTSTPLPTPARYAIPTFASTDPLTLEVQALAQKFDAPLQQGPGWVHVIWENVIENRQPSQVFYPPPYYQDEQWYEIDAQGWVIRSLTTQRGANGEIFQQSARVGYFVVNFTFGDTFTDIQLYRLSLDMLTHSLARVAQNNAAVTREEVSCEDGSPCLLVTMLDTFGQPIQNPGETQAFRGLGHRVWISMQSGQQVKFESFWVVGEGQERVDFTQRALLVEKVPSAPQWVLDLLAKVVAP